MTRSPITAGGEVNWNSPGQSNGLPGSTWTAPSWPKSAHGLPSSRSSAISRRSAVAVRIRSAHRPAAPLGPRQTATPRQANTGPGRKRRPRPFLGGAFAFQLVGPLHLLRAVLQLARQQPQVPLVEVEEPAVDQRGDDVEVGRVLGLGEGGEVVGEAGPRELGEADLLAGAEGLHALAGGLGHGVSPLRNVTGEMIVTVRFARGALEMRAKKAPEFRAWISTKYLKILNRTATSGTHGPRADRIPRAAGSRADARPDTSTLMLGNGCAVRAIA